MNFRSEIKENVIFQTHKSALLSPRVFLFSQCDFVKAIFLIIHVIVFRVSIFVSTNDTPRLECTTSFIKNVPWQEKASIFFKIVLFYRIFKKY